MEGAGEGVVAVVQGTKNAGLKVTMLPDCRLRLRRKCVLLDLGGINPSPRLTQRVLSGSDRVHKNASAPICDVKYTSSYQFENCICESRPTQFVSSKFRRYGVFTRHSGQFEDSLRKYPVVNASSEILQRIINYTNTEQSNRKPNFRSVRSILRKSTSHDMNHETGVNTDYTQFKKILRPSVSTIGHKYSSQKELFNYTYDYLKCTSLIPKSTDVRYFTQIKKCIRDRLLNIIDDKSTVCPKIRSRYSQHRKNFHNNNSKQMETSLSRNKGYFHQQKKCVCKSKSNKVKPLESLMKKLYADLFLNKEEKIQTCREICKDQDVDNIMLVVSEWLKTIPVFPTFCACDKKKQEEMAQKLAKNLSELKNDKDFISKAKLEIMGFLNSSPIWHPTDLKEKDQFFEQIVFDLIKRLNNTFNQEVEQNIAKILTRLPYKENIDIKKIQDYFIHQVKSTVLRRPKDDGKSREVIKSKVLDLLTKLPVESKIENLHELTDEIVDQLLHFHESVQGDEVINADEIKIRENILNFCKNVPELANIDFSDDLYLIDELASKVKEYKNLGLNDDDVKENLKNDVQNWLNDVERTRNIRLNSKTKNELSIKMLEQVLGTDYSWDQNKSSDLNNAQEYLEPLTKWFHGIPQLGGDNLAKNRKDLAKLAKELKEIQSRELPYESINANMKNHIYEWLQNKFSHEGKHVESKDLDNLVNDIMSDLTYNPKRSQKTDEDYSHIDHNNDIMKLIQRFNNIRKSLDSTTQINDAVSEFIQSLSAKVGVDINEEDENVLKDKLFERWRQTSKKRKRWDKVKESYPKIQSEINDILKEYSTSLGNNNVNNIYDKIFDSVKKNIKENSLLNLEDLNSEIKNILRQETDLTRSDEENLANRIFHKLQKVLPQEVIRKSYEFGSDMETLPESNSEPKKKLKKQKIPRGSGIERDDDKFKTEYGRNKIFQAGDVQELPTHSKTLSTIYQSSNSDLDRQNSMDYSGNSYKTRGDRRKQLAFNEKRKIRTSTPISTKVNKKPTTIDHDSSNENLIESTEKNTLGREFSECSEYFTKIRNITMDWFKNNELINTTDLDFDEVVSSIASDFVERQKYLQLSKRNYSESDELEHLKYQIFRKLNKLTSYDKIPKILSEINGLHSLIRKVSTPDLVMTEKSKLFKSKKAHDSMLSVIAQWLDGVSPNLLNCSDIKKQLDLAKKIAINLESIEKDGSHDYEIQKEILLWLQNILKVNVDKISHELGKNVQPQLRDVTSFEMLEQDSSTHVDEIILEAIIEWIKNTPFYKVAYTEERDLQRNLALFLATNLSKILQDTKIKDDDKNKLLMEEVQKYLKTIIFDKEFRNSTFYKKAAAELVNFVKDRLKRKSKMSETIAKTPDNAAEIEDSIRQVVTSWCDNLPIHLGHDAKSKEQAEKLKQDIAKQILDTTNNLNLASTSSDIPLNDMLSNEIDKIFNNVPMNNELEKSLPVLKSILIDKIIRAKTEYKNIDHKKQLQETLTETLKEIENVSDLESLSLVLLKEKLVDAFINLHNDECIDNEFRAKLKGDLYNVVNKFCHNYLQRRTDTPLDTKELRYNLSDTLKNALKMKGSDSSKKSPTQSLNNLLPSSSLSIKDRDHLDRIRKRVTTYNEKETIVIPTRGLCGNVKDIEIQTNLQIRVEDFTQTSKTMLTENGSFNREVIPQVIIKEYYWDSNGSKHSLQMVVPPELSPCKKPPKKKETCNSQNQTEIKLINRSRKVHISQQFPDTNTIRGPLSSSCENKCPNSPNLPPLRDLINRQKRRENSLHQRKCDRNNTGYLNNNTCGRNWFDQQGFLENSRFANDCRQRLNSVAFPDDRIVLRRRMCFKDNPCCDHNTSCRLKQNTCRSRCSNKLRPCSKCPGTFCPHPTLAFFSKEF